LLEEFDKHPELKLHIIVLRKTVAKDFCFERNRVMFHILKVPGGWRAPSFFWLDTVLIRRCLRHINPDLVHAWGTERGAALVASRLGYPYLVTIQGLMTWYGEVLSLPPYERFAAFLERFSLRRARLATTESVFAVQYLSRHYPKLKVRQAEHAPNWLFHHIERRPQTESVRFLAVGSLDYRKGSDILLKGVEQLLAELPFELILVGSPNQPFLDSLKEELSPNLWKRIQFKSNLTPAEVARELAQATIAVLPTRADTSPNAVKEAVVAGVPVVATQVGGIPDYVHPGENGLLCPPNDLPGFLEALRAACHHPLFRKGKVQPQTLSQVRAYLSPERMGKTFFESYLDVLGQRPCST
jgi:glycosyltransferase involved in cell wall biosynthesis